MISINKLAAPFRGIVTPVITPLSIDGKIDRESLKRLLNFIIDGGVNGIFILGTTGEAPSLSYHQKHEMIVNACELAGDRVPVFVGITDSSPAESLLLDRLAKEAGATAVVAAPPFYYHLNQEELKLYYTHLADNLELPLFLYNMPSQTKIVIEPETVKILSLHPKIIGIKDSSGNAFYFNTLLCLLKDNKKFTVLVGPDEMMASAVLLGGHGGVNAGSNLFPELFVNLYDAASGGNLKRTIELQEKVMEHSLKITQVGTSGPAALKGLKMALSIKGFCQETMALPLIHYGDKEKKIIRGNLKSLFKAK